MTTRRALERYSGLVVLEELLEAGLEVEADRPQLRIRPAHNVPDELLAEARRLKPYILDVLDPPAPEEPCPDCAETYFARRPLGRWTCLGCGDIAIDAAVRVVRAGPTGERGVQTSATNDGRGAPPVS